MQDTWTFNNERRSYFHIDGMEVYEYELDHSLFKFGVTVVEQLEKIKKEKEEANK